MESVCAGAGRLAEHRRTGGFDNPFPAEVGLFSLRGSDVLADIPMAFSQVARSYIEGFALYGDRRGVEWPIDNQGPLRCSTCRARPRAVAATRWRYPNWTHRMSRPLPESLRAFVRPTQAHFRG